MRFFQSMVAAATDDPRVRELTRLVGCLDKSENSQSLLQCMGDHELANPGTRVPESELLKSIGKLAKDLPANSELLRVAIHRLREKIGAYYEKQLPSGPDCIVSIVTCPRGGYRCQFYTKSEPVGRQDAVSQFLREFVAGSGPTLVIFSNNEFIQAKDGSLRELQSAQREAINRDLIPDSPDRVLITGVGEVLAAARLQRAMQPLGLNVELVRGRLPVYEQAQDRHTIYLGSPFSNVFLGALDAERERLKRRRFVFAEQRLEDGSLQYRIVDRGSPPERVLTRERSEDGYTWFDYALICLHTKENATRDLILAGITTHGTQAATDFICSEAGIGKICAVLDTAAWPDFEVVLKIRILNGAPATVELMKDWIYLRKTPTGA